MCAARVVHGAASIAPSNLVAQIRQPRIRAELIDQF
jgi:hypothetical protein